MALKGRTVGWLVVSMLDPGKTRRPEAVTGSVAPRIDSHRNTHMHFNGKSKRSINTMGGKGSSMMKKINVRLVVAMIGT